MKRVVLNSDLDLYEKADTVSINDHSASKIYAYTKLRHSGWEVFHSAMFKRLIDHAPAHSQSQEIVTFYFINSLGAMEGGQYPGEDTSSRQYQSEANLVMDKIKEGRTVYEFENDREYRQWAGNIEKELATVSYIEQRGW